MNIGWPQGIFLFLLILQFGINLALHGELKDELGQHYNAGVSLINITITLGLLYAGGFFG